MQLLMILTILLMATTQVFSAETITDNSVLISENTESMVQHGENEEELTSSSPRNREGMGESGENTEKRAQYPGKIKIKITPSPMFKKGFDRGIGAKLTLSCQYTAKDMLTLSGAYLPLDFKILEDHERVDYYKISFSWLRAIRKRVTVKLTNTLYLFNSNPAFLDYVTAQGAETGAPVLYSPDLTISYLLFSFKLGFLKDISFLRRFSEKKIPVSFSVSFSVPQDFNYGIYLTDAGDAYRANSKRFSFGFGFSFPGFGGKGK